MKLKAVFLDRDGTINVAPPEGEYVSNPSELVLIEGAAEAIRLFNEAGVRTIVVTNQRGIARGLMTEGDYADVTEKLRAELRANGAHLDLILYCPHAAGKCKCRKPQPGMLVQGFRAFSDIEPASSVLIGDKQIDVDAARSAGIDGILLGQDTKNKTLLVTARRLVGTFAR